MIREGFAEISTSTTWVIFFFWFFHCISFPLTQNFLFNNEEGEECI